MKLRALLLSLLVAGIGAALCFAAFARVRREAQGGEPVRVVAVTRDLAPGAVLTRDVLAVRTIPRAYVEERHVPFEDTETVVGLRAVSALRAGEALLWNDVDDEAIAAARLAAVIGEGRRAVTVRVHATSAFTGLLRPGDRVDVLHFAPRLGSEERVTAQLLENVLVLAVAGTLDPSSPSRCGATSAQQVTVAATVDEAQRLVHAQSTGDLHLVLRNPDDVEPMLSMGDPVTDADVLVAAERRRRRARSDVPSSIR
ncbi:Flp pilus assembly protein CpaB [Sandaracinus amylolyticus]|uniref:Flp pilus assembly protein RcpC/CpaB n=1 Tax=Sandaracinus amylolyticus TaxID=927083 RepID=A0A0F6VZM7_9BACT|nr:Flp pilus assembly protein CpaB [Sandaracinus amylolyticus]AKF03712.1 Flp pilus assembly protein RcpC/CpaB [Sandaracinus amylolyticus]